MFYFCGRNEGIEFVEKRKKERKERKERKRGKGRKENREIVNERKFKFYEMINAFRFFFPKRLKFVSIRYR